MPSFRAELRFQRQGWLRVAGLDEVGRGSWAGPLVAGAVILPIPTRALRQCLSAVNDSKLLTPDLREECAALIRQHAIAFAIGCASVAEIDQYGLTRATHQAMRRAIEALVVEPDALLLDAFPLPATPWPQRAIVRGDSFSYSIAAASIIAKTARDGMMRELGASFPQYGFESHKGYGTEAHQRALREFGVSPAHRRSWRPIRELIAPSMLRDAGNGAQ